MVCPSCNQEYSDGLDRCPDCSARPRLGVPPAVAAGAVEGAADAEPLHCTTCGARALPGLNFCQQCGEPTTPGAEWDVGACLNCGGTWHKSWQFCRTCGVSRTNALIDETINVPLLLTARAAPRRPPGQPPALKARGALLACPHCGAELAEEVNYCNECGVRVQAMFADLLPPRAAGLVLTAEDEGAPPVAVPPRRLPDAAEDARPADREGEAVAGRRNGQPGGERGGSDAADAAPQEAGLNWRGQSPEAPARRFGLSRRQLGVVILALLSALLLAFLTASGTPLSDLLRKLRALIALLGPWR
jgi:hypothetical protein